MKDGKIYPLPAYDVGFYRRRTTRALCMHQWYNQAVSRRGVLLLNPIEDAPVVLELLTESRSFDQEGNLVQLHLQMNDRWDLDVQAALQRMGIEVVQD